MWKTTERACSMVQHICNPIHSALQRFATIYTLTFEPLVLFIVLSDMHPSASWSLCVLLAATLQVTAASPPIAPQDGFFFGNPSLDCEFVSQPRIYSIFSSLETDVTNLINHISPDVDFTVVGHQPLAGHYHDLKHFYVNALYRLNNCIRLKYPNEYRIELQYITGGCDQNWSVQEVLFSGRANNGM